MRTWRSGLHSTLKAPKWLPLNSLQWCRAAIRTAVWQRPWQSAPATHTYPSVRSERFQTAALGYMRQGHSDPGVKGITRLIHASADALRHCTPANESLPSVLHACLPKHTRKCRTHASAGRHCASRSPPMRGLMQACWCSKGGVCILDFMFSSSAPSCVSTCVWSVRCVFVACGLLVRKSLLVGRSLANRLNRK